jgi:hypothetical protein
MVSKGDGGRQGNPEDRSAELDLIKEQLGGEVVDPDSSVEVDRWHADNIDQRLFRSSSLERVYSDDDLRDIVDYETFLSSLNPDDILNAADYIGTGAQILLRKDRMRLVGTGLHIIQWNFSESAEFAGGWFAYLELITIKNSIRYAMTDGTKFGLRDQLATVSIRSGRFNHLPCPNGFKHRNYTPVSEPTISVDVLSIP